MLVRSLVGGTKITHTPEQLSPCSLFVSQLESPVTALKDPAWPGNSMPSGNLAGYSPEGHKEPGGADTG